LLTVFISLWYNKAYSNREEVVKIIVETVESGKVVKTQVFTNLNKTTEAVNKVIRSTCRKYGVKDYSLMCDFELKKNAEILVIEKDCMDTNCTENPEVCVKVKHSK
jgi:hypothetical protein